MVDMSGVGDAELVRRVLSGDPAAFAGLVTRYRDRLGRYAVRMLGNQADAEDALQETFVRAYRSLGRCTDADRFGAWVFGILVNRCRTLGAQRARRERLQVADDAALLRAASHDDPVGRQALRAAITAALGQLAPLLREAFLLRFVEELSYEEMADVTGASVSALKMRVLRARTEMQRLLGDVTDA
ncbi:MAG: RNA polymerase sigma factor [Gemmatimonadota bacterium]|nr:RNA polymerase sigma factor [Gemmatimonadota bacterium]MDH4349770.1 RNA polymerase sigma factor [Gemmatimonadota bacterium]